VSLSHQSAATNLASVTHLRPAPALNIEVASGVGLGPTKIAAFDGALRQAGVHNFNLIYLSSVVPPGSIITPLVEGKAATPPGNWGDRLYVVMASERVDEIGQEAWAGVGWVQQEGSSKGLFVEHEGHSEAQVRRDIAESLRSLCEGRPETFGPVQSVVRGATCTTEGEAVCALVVAVFESAPWKGELIDLSAN
jgi:arginine decarboxylase